MNIEYLKEGHETFDCNLCKYNSNNVEEIRKHLKQHVSNKPKAMKVVKDWRYNYDDDGNPIDEDTDDDISTDDNDNTDEE